MAKTGLGGIGLLVVPIMASIFGAKSSTGVLLIILIVADFFGVIYYHQHADIKKLIKLIPSTILGIVLAVLAGHVINENQFKIFLAIIILSGVVLMIFTGESKNYINYKSNIYLTSLFGTLGGLSTMIGNAAGPVMTIYFLSMGFQKNMFIGTTAWFFLFVNLFKVPFHVLIWNTINLKIFFFGLTCLPLILIGAFIGILSVKKIPENFYRLFLIFSVVLSVLKLIFIF